MDLSTRRWRIKSVRLNPGYYRARDNQPPYFGRIIKSEKLPPLDRIEQMSEAEFDECVACAVYGEQKNDEI